MEPRTEITGYLEDLIFKRVFLIKSGTLNCVLVPDGQNNNSLEMSRC